MDDKITSEANKSADIIRTAGAWVGVCGVIAGIVLILLAIGSDWLLLPGAIATILVSIFLYALGRALAAILLVMIAKQ